MGVRLCMLGSGSSGNCSCMVTDEGALLIDGGLSARQTVLRLAEIGVDISDVRAICVSHEHQDHICGLRVLHQRHGIPLYANAATVDSLRRYPDIAALPWNLFSTGHPFALGNTLIEPFSVPHDAADPVGFVITNGTNRVGVVTDMGMPTALIRERLRRCHAIVLESNYDEQLLHLSARPWSLKQRIRGRQGHLSNDGAAQLLTEIANPDMQHVFLAHLSEDCNRPDLALQSATTALQQAGCDHVRVAIAYPNRVSDIWSCP